jgi:hypothetical protein
MGRGAVRREEAVAPQSFANVEPYCRNREKGTWSGEPGNSKWKPEPGSEAEQALKDFKQDGVQYRNGKPDFSPFMQKGLMVSPSRPAFPTCKEITPPKLAISVERGRP